MIECRNLEMHVAHGCNLSCESCSHYSNHHHTGMLSLATAREWLSGWSRRLQPRQFSLLGGEPALNPALPQFVWLVREMFPDTQIILVSNGFLLKRHPRLPVALRGTQTALHISVHHDSDEYQRKLEPVRELIADWQRRWNIDVCWRNSFESWTRRYRGFGKEMQPFDDGDPEASWQNCPAKWCLQLHEGKLWKCPAIAYLGMQDRKYGLGDEWQPYLGYEPLDPGCSDTELGNFVERRSEAVCGMCPAQVEQIALVNLIEESA